MNKRDGNPRAEEAQARSLTVLTDACDAASPVQWVPRDTKDRPVLRDSGGLSSRGKGCASLRTLIATAEFEFNGLRVMNTSRYFLALLLVVSLPPLWLYWLMIHSFIKFWRGKGSGFTYGTVLSLVVAAMIALFFLRHLLLRVEFGTNYLLIALGAICLAFAAAMRFALQRHLPIKVLVGLPEIAPNRFPRRLITDGIYGRLRHPRYVQLLIALLGYALIANYLAAYLAVALWLPGVYIIVLLEESELREHFGSAYDEYCRAVPRFIPKRARGRNRPPPAADR